MNWEKLVSRWPTSSHRRIPIITQRRALRTRLLKMENYEKSWLHHWKRKVKKTVNHLDYQLHRGNLLQCFHLEAKNRETNSRVLFSNTLTRQIWENLFLKAIKIICLVREDLATNSCSKIGISGRTTQIYWISTRTSSSTRRTIYEGKTSPRYSNPKYARNERNEKSSRTRSWRILSAKIRRKSWDNTEAHFINCRKCKSRWIPWMIQERISWSGIESQ